MNRPNKRVILASLALALAALGQGPPPALVEAVQAEMREIPATLTLVATVQPVRRSVIAAEVAGLVVEVPARQGDAVQAGQALCKLDDDVMSLQLAEARGRLSALDARLAELQNGTRPEELRRLKSLYEEAAAVLERWSFEMERIRSLYGEHNAGQKEVYETKALLKGAEEKAEGARAMYEMGQKGPRQEEIDRAAFEVAEQKSVVARLERDVSKCAIRAPYAGVVVRLATETGQWIDQGGPVVELIDLSSVLVRVSVPESAVNYAAPGTPARVAIDALKTTFDGTVKHVIPQAQEGARTFPVEIEVANPDGMLKAGMFARATVIAGPAQKMVAVPKDAIVQRHGVSYVMVVQPGQQGTMAVPTPIELGASSETWIGVTGGGIDENSRVVVRGNEGIYFPSPVVVAE